MSKEVEIKTDGGDVSVRLVWAVLYEIFPNEPYRNVVTLEERQIEVIVIGTQMQLIDDVIFSPIKRDTVVRPAIFANRGDSLPMVMFEGYTVSKDETPTLSANHSMGRILRAMRLLIAGKLTMHDAAAVGAGLLPMPAIEETIQ